MFGSSKAADGFTVRLGYNVYRRSTAKKGAKLLPYADFATSLATFIRLVRHYY